MLTFIDYIAAKKIIAPALSAMDGGPSRVFQQTSRVMEASNVLGSRGVASKNIRPDVDPMGMLRALYGIATTGSTHNGPRRRRNL